MGFGSDIPFRPFFAALAHRFGGSPPPRPSIVELLAAERCLGHADGLLDAARQLRAMAASEAEFGDDHGSAFAAAIYQFELLAAAKVKQATTASGDSRGESHGRAQTEEPHHR